MSAIQRCKNNRNRFIIAIVLGLERSCRCQICARPPAEVSVQLLRILHPNQQPHMIFTHLASIVEPNERNSTLQK